MTLTFEQMKQRADILLTRAEQESTIRTWKVARKACEEAGYTDVIKYCDEHIAALEEIERRRKAEQE
jgi:hypothetical protein